MARLRLILNPIFVKRGVCVRTQIDRFKALSTEPRAWRPDAAIQLSRCSNYIGLRLNGGIRSLRSRFSTETKVVGRLLLTGYDCQMNDVNSTQFSAIETFRSLHASG